MLDIQDGTLSGPGNVRTSYWELADEVSLDREATPGAVAKPAAQRRLAGQSVQRVDIPDKVFAHRRFIHDCALPGMLHGRVLRPEISGARLVVLQDKDARAVAGLLAIVRDGSFAGVVCETEDGAEAALKALHKGATWSEGEALPDEDRLAEWLKAQPAELTVIDQKTAAGAPDRKRTIRRQYSRPYIAHGSIAPSCAMAQWTGNQVHVWTHSQGVYLLRADLALVLKLPLEDITVEHLEGAGCYGHNAADDVALDAVLLARAAEWTAGPRAMVARKRDVTCPVRGRDGDRDRGRPRRGWRDCRLAAQYLEQRPCGAAGACDNAGAARGDRTFNPVSAHHLEQSAAGQWRRGRSQFDSTL